MTLRTLKYGNYGIFLIMGNAGFCPSTVVLVLLQALILEVGMKVMGFFFRAVGAYGSGVLGRTVRGFRV